MPPAKGAVSMESGRRDGRIKIYISGHKDCAAVQNEVFVPVQQKAIVRFLMDGTPEDRFMAAHANEYCELLTQYWAWKYDDADYYGFCHYRRYFEFNDAVKGSDARTVRRTYLNARTAAELGLADVPKIKQIVGQYDVTVPKPVNYYLYTVYWQWQSADTLHIRDLDTVMEIIRSEYPDYYPAAKSYLYGHYFYGCNMFVMRRELFLPYCEWLFAILRRFYERRDMAADGYSGEAMRTPGHLGERLFGIYLTWLMQQKRYTIGKRRTAVFENTQPPFAALPAFGGSAVTLFMPADAGSVALAAAALRSVADAASFERRYDVVMLTSGLVEQDRLKLRAVLHGRTNFSLRFFDADRFCDERGIASLSPAEKEAFCLFMLPHLFTQHSRAVWLDACVVALEDIAALYDADLGAGDCCAAVADVCLAGGINGHSEHLREYYRALGAACGAVAEPGVLVLNLPAMRAAYREQELYGYLHGSPEFPLRDALNYFCGGKIRFLEGAWNVVPEREGSERAVCCTFAPQKLYLAYRAAAQSPRLLHFSGSDRPWEDADSVWAHIFWRVSRETPYGEGLLAALCRSRPAKKEGNWFTRRAFPHGTRRRSLLHRIRRWFGRT